MDRLTAMQVFVAVFESGSFSAAARKLNKPQTTISRQVKDLEEYLGVQLILRTTRTLSLTEAGRNYLSCAKKLLDSLSEMEQEVKGEFKEPKGNLTITAPIIMGRMHVFPLLAEYMNAFPDVSVRLILTDQNMHLYEDLVDIAIRVGNLPNSDLVAKKIGEVHKILCASPEYIERNGMPKSPQALSHHSVITFEGLDSTTRWRFSEHGKDIDVPVVSRMKANSTDIAVLSARESLGIARVLSYQALPYLMNNELVRILNEYNPPALPVNLLFIRHDPLPIKQRSFIDFMVPRLQARLADVARDWHSLDQQNAN